MHFFKKDFEIGCIYSVSSELLGDNRVYIGQTVQKNPYDRWEKHKKDLAKKQHSSNKLQNFYNKYFINNLKFNIISNNIPIINLDFYEKFFIKILNSQKEGFNETDGGTGGVIRQTKTQIKNIFTNEILTFNSRVECAKFLGVRNTVVNALFLKPKNGKNGKSATNVICDVWSKPEFEPKFYEFFNMHTHETVKIYDLGVFAKNNNISHKNIASVAHENSIETSGWRLLKNKDFVSKEGKGVEFSLLSPNKEIFKFKSVAEAIEKLPIGWRGIQKLIRGIKENHRGWTLLGVDYQPKLFKTQI